MIGMFWNLVNLKIKNRISKRERLSLRDTLSPYIKVSKCAKNSFVTEEVNNCEKGY